MVTYKCFDCGEKIKDEELEKNFMCLKCGSRIFFKARNKPKVVKTD
ncbi:MAG: DNA-directed RNA polymerase subunit P [Candidatus Pacearchaeota archaeon]